MDLPGSMITIRVPSISLQLHHEMFPPHSFPETTFTCLLSALRRGQITDGYRWVITAGTNKFAVLHQSQMTGLVNLALANNWTVKGYTPHETNKRIKPINEED